jgi:uncharacterized protein with HEPN domain
MRSKLGDRQRAQHILDAIAEIEQYVENLTLEAFEQNSLVRHATERQLTIIGEAANAITEETRTRFPELDWKGIRGFRNLIVHEYFGISVSMVWAVVIKELPLLKQVADKISAEATPE